MLRKHILLQGKALLTSQSFVYPKHICKTAVRSKVYTFRYMIQSVHSHIMEGVCPILGKKTRGIKSFLFLEASDTNIC